MVERVAQSSVATRVCDRPDLRVAISIPKPTYRGSIATVGLLSGVRGDQGGNMNPAWPDQAFMSFQRFAMFPKIARAMIATKPMAANGSQTLYCGW